MASTDTGGSPGLLSSIFSIFSAGPVKPGDSYGAPGRGNSTAIAIASAVGLFALWYLVTLPGLFGEKPLIKPLFLPSPAAVWIKFVSVVTEGYQDATLWEHTQSSFLRIFIAFALAAVTAIPIGIAMATNRIFRGIFDPPIEFYRPLPPLGYLPLTVIWFGIGETQKLVLLYLAMFAPMVLNTRAGVPLRRHGADPRGLFARRQPLAGPLARDPERRDAGNPHRHAHRHRLRLDNTGRRRTRRHRTGSRRHDHERV